jgi:lysine 6-dehydrogenase
MMQILFLISFYNQTLKSLIIPTMTNQPSPHQYRYLILGSGRQGTAAGYDLALFGSASQILMADFDEQTAVEAARRINQLAGVKIAQPLRMDVRDHSELEQALQGVDCVLSAVPYYFNLEITRAAIKNGVHLCDMGGNTAIVQEQLELDGEAKEAGVSVVPDCGMGPGLINTMGAYAIELLDEPEEVLIYDAGLPQDPQPPWNYQLTFHINGLTNEMDGKAVFLRDGEIAYVDTLSEPEFIEFPPFGRLEADVTSGGTSTAPWTFQDKVKRYENKVLRFPGHYDWLRAFKTLGLFSEEPILVGDQTVVPRQVYHTLLEPQITGPGIRDVGIIRSVGTGIKDGRQAKVVIDLVDYYDEKTSFTAMERLTGWHCSVVMAFQVKGEVKPGVVPVETALHPKTFMEALQERGITHEVRWE